MLTCLGFCWRERGKTRNGNWEVEKRRRNWGWCSVVLARSCVCILQLPSISSISLCFELLLSHMGNLGIVGRGPSGDACRGLVGRGRERGAEGRGCQLSCNLGASPCGSFKGSLWEVDNYHCREGNVGNHGWEVKKENINGYPLVSWVEGKGYENHCWLNAGMWQCSPIGNWKGE